MFDLSGQAAAIVARLQAEESLGTVAFVEDDDESGRYPVSMPAAFVVLDEVNPGAGSKKGVVAPEITWAVIVRSKSLQGTGGCLPNVDRVMSVLVGFDPGEGCKPLSLGKVEFYDKKHESVAYIVRFSTVAAGKSDNARCGR